jgi:hypothetical protein
MRISYVIVRVPYQAEQEAACRMRVVTLDIDPQLIGDATSMPRASRVLDLDKSTQAWNGDIDALRVASVARGPLLASSIAPEASQQTEH